MQDTPFTSPFDLEEVKDCPVCHSTEFESLYPDLYDILFRSSSSKWNLVKCSRCRSGFLKYRPTVETIGEAYKTYHTHDMRSYAPKSPKLNLIKFVRKTLANGYRNHVYGSNLSPSSRPLGVVAASLMPLLKRTIIGEAPGLLNTKERQKKASSVLDIGCGSGGALQIAMAAGWIAKGVEPDPKAAEAARTMGVDIIGSTIEDLASSYYGSFDRIMLSHVIEHVHDPLSFLKKCFELLKPNGTLWLETPNFNSAGHSLYGMDWRGLEPPRHLVLFTPSSISMLLAEAGFSDILMLPARDVMKDMFETSYRLQMARVLGSDTMPELSSEQRSIVKKAVREATATSSADQSEFIMLEAIR